MAITVGNYTTYESLAKSKAAREALVALAAQENLGNTLQEESFSTEGITANAVSIQNAIKQENWLEVEGILKKQLKEVDAQLSILDQTQTNVGLAKVQHYTTLKTALESDLNQVTAKVPPNQNIIKRAQQVGLFFAALGIFIAFLVMFAPISPFTSALTLAGTGLTTISLFFVPLLLVLAYQAYKDPKKAPLGRWALGLLVATAIFVTFISGGLFGPVIAGIVGPSFFLLIFVGLAARYGAKNLTPTTKYAIAAVIAGVSALTLVILFEPNFVGYTGSAFVFGTVLPAVVVPLVVFLAVAAYFAWSAYNKEGVQLTAKEVQPTLGLAADPDVVAGEPMDEAPEYESVTAASKAREALVQMPAQHGIELGDTLKESSFSTKGITDNAIAIQNAVNQKDWLEVESILKKQLKEVNAQLGDLTTKTAITLVDAKIRHYTALQVALNTDLANIEPKVTKDQRTSRTMKRAQQVGFAFVAVGIFTSFLVMFAPVSPFASYLTLAGTGLTTLGFFALPLFLILAYQAWKNPDKAPIGMVPLVVLFIAGILVVPILAAGLWGPALAGIAGPAFFLLAFMAIGAKPLAEKLTPNQKYVIAAVIAAAAILTLTILFAPHLVGYTGSAFVFGAVLPAVVVPLVVFLAIAAYFTWSAAYGKSAAPVDESLLVTEKQLDLQLATDPVQQQYQPFTPPSQTPRPRSFSQSSQSSQPGGGQAQTYAAAALQPDPHAAPQQQPSQPSGSGAVVNASPLAAVTALTVPQQQLQQLEFKEHKANSASTAAIPVDQQQQLPQGQPQGVPQVFTNHVATSPHQQPQSTPAPADDGLEVKDANSIDLR